MLLRGLGRFRPMDSMEQADLANKQAQTQYMLSRPDQAAHRMAVDEAKLGLAQGKEERLAGQHKDYMAMRERAMAQGNALKQQALAAMQLRDGNKMSQAANAIEQRMMQTAQILKMKMQKAGESGWFSGPDPNRLNSMIDPKTKEVGNPIPGDWDMWKGSFKADYDLLRQLGVKEVPEEIDQVFTEIEGMSPGQQQGG